MTPEEHFNGLTPAEAERLAILIEECGEVIQAATKILRHGYESRNPLDGTEAPTNRRDLEKECGHVRAAMIRLCDVGDLRKDQIHQSAEQKARTLHYWMHHDKP